MLQALLQLVPLADPCALGSTYQLDPKAVDRKQPVNIVKTIKKGTGFL